MQVDFFKFSEDVKPVKEFGLVDTPPAEINYDENQKDSWNAIVECNNREDYHFAPLDKKLKIMESFNKEESICECLLHTEKSICFVELKERKKQHTQKAIEQLKKYESDERVLEAKKLGKIIKKLVIISTATECKVLEEVD